MYVELGAALTRATATGSPGVFVVGPKNHASIFYFHPLTRHFSDIDQCLTYIRAEYGDQIGRRRSSSARRLSKTRESATEVSAEP